MRILHIADLHLDTPFESLPADKAAQLRAEQREVLGEIVRIADGERVDLVLIAGDLFDGSNVYQETIRALDFMLRELRMPVFIAPGNHDYYTERSPLTKLASDGRGIYLFTGHEITSVTLSEIGVRVHGAGFTDSVCPPLLENFSVERDPEFPELIEIMLMHGNVGEKGEERYNSISEGAIERSGLDYLALGHVHSFSGLRQAGDTYYAYPGCAIGRSFRETGERGVMVAELTRGHCELRFVPLSSRRYECVDVDLTGTGSSTEDALRAVYAQLPEYYAEDIYRITFTGEFEALDLSRLTRMLEPEFFHLRLVDKTIPPLELWTASDEYSLRGLFTKKLRERYDSAENEDERNLITQAVRWGLAALNNSDIV